MLILFILIVSLASPYSSQAQCTVECTSGGTIFVGSGSSNVTLWKATTVESRASTPDFTSGGTYAWEDINVDLVARQSGPSVPPFSQLSTFGVYGYSFPGNTKGTQILYYNVHIPHRYASGTGIYFHTHFVPIDTGLSGNVVFTYTFTYADRNTGTYGASSTATATYSVGTGDQYKHFVAETATPVLSAVQVDGVFMVSVTRSAASDTYSGTIYLIFCDAHIQVNKHGTYSKDPPYYG